MIGSTLPEAERLDQHPVHRATTLLREALQNSGATSPDPAEIWDESAFDLDPAPTELTHGPVSISFPPPLAALLGPSAEDGELCQPPVMSRRDGTAPDPSPETPREGGEMLDRAAEAHLQKLVQAFYRRQQQASLLVACSVATAFVLTLAGLLLLFSVNDSQSSGPKAAPPKDESSVAWTTPGAESGQALGSTRVQTNRAAKAAPLPVSKVDAQPQASDHTGAQVVLADTGRPLALGPLLPLGSARYLLLRGLPEEATLSAGRKTGPGTWMVKGADVPGLTVTTGESANGDYPLEVYLLDTANGPQARHRLILRVDQSPRVYTAGFGLTWPFTPQDAESGPEVAAGESTEADASRARAQALLSEGDIAAARVILSRLAENGNKDAAYELALTHDPEVLAKAGVRGVGSDPETAREWYAYAARQGHTAAAERLRTLTRPRGGA